MKEEVIRHYSWLKNIQVFNVKVSLLVALRTTNYMHLSQNCP